MKRALTLLLSLLILVSGMSVSAVADTEEKEEFNYDSLTYSGNAESYVNYLKKYNPQYPSDDIVLEAKDSSGASEANNIYKDYNGMKGISLYTSATDSVSWSFEVKTEGYYNVLLNYYPIAGTGSSIERSILIDGVIPFSESERLVFSRICSNKDGKVQVDTQGNQIMIEQVEKPAWISQYAVDASGTVTSPLQYYFSAGKHTLTFASVLEPVVIKSLVLKSVSVDGIADYKTVSKGYDFNSSKASKQVITMQGEDADRKSTQMLFPLSDQTSPDVVPSSPYQIVYNTIGRNQWTNAGQWAEWDFTVKETGYYALSAHFKQSLKDGRASVRRILIDGETPFKEADNWMFPYNSSWQNGTFSDKNDQPYVFYLEAGKHTIRLTVGLGDYAEIISESSEYLSELNSAYRSIIAISGASPDQYRDYKFDEMIPDTIKKMGEISSSLKKLEKKVLSTDGNSKNIPDIKRVYDQIDMMTKDTDTISARLSSFKDNIASFGTWINTQRGQPLELDWLSFTSKDTKTETKEAGFWATLWYNLKRFFYSFIVDYHLIGQTNVDAEKKIKVWITTSQDQAQLLRQLVISDFSPSTNIAVEVQLVSTKALLPAILAHKGPDVALGIQQAEVNNLALRNAIYNMANFSDVEDKKADFYDYSLVPFEWNGGIYGMPETLTWPMLFYRKDILDELEIPVSDLSTWDSLLNSVLPKLKKSSLSFGVMPTIQNYLNFLYQNGGSLYTDQGKKSGLASSEAIESMKLFTILYTQYGFPLSFDFANRFRTGEMPIAIADFTSYNNLMLFASEIKGLWGMCPVPGTVDVDGNVNHTAVSTETGTVIMSDSKDKDAAWEFVKWWTSEDAQDSFGKSLEAVVGSSSRYNTANKNAISKVNWDPDMKESMLYQAEHLQAYPEVPGGYFTGRLFNFAFRSIVYESEAVRESMDDVANNINREMLNKRKEYGIE